MTEKDIRSSSSSRRFKPYPSYKDFGVEWLGKIPATWRCSRLRHVALINPTKSEIHALDPALLVSFVPMEAVGELGGLNLEVTKPLAMLTEGYTYFRDNDVVVAKITPCFENGKGALAQGLLNGVAFGTTELHVLRSAPEVDPHFLFYLTVSDHFRRLGAAEMYGAAGQKRVPEDFILNFRHPLPSLEDQRLISDILDRETAKIDALIAKKERLIELLQEKRTALITQAVTKGLDPNVPMKDSGIEWLGKIPGHWDLVPLKHLLSRCDYGLSENLAGLGDVRVLTMANIQDGEINLPASGCLEEVPDEFLLDDKDLLFNRTNSRDLVGKVGLFRGSRKDKVSFASYLVRMRIREGVSPQFLDYLLNSTGLLALARSMALLSINQANLNPTKYTQITMPLPSDREQEAISNLLSRESQKLEVLTAKIRKAIGWLKEYRTALISAAVTGKIDVRGES